VVTTGLHYPDNLYADALLGPRQGVQGVPGTPTGAYRSTDPVTKPAHYQRAGIETIDYIRATLDGPGFEAYCIGNVLKYVSRYREKGGIEDLRKAQVYLGWAIQPVDGKRQSQPECCNPAADRDAMAAHDYLVGYLVSYLGFPRIVAEKMAAMPSSDDATKGEVEVPERVPKWHPDWLTTPPNCDGHPMQAEAIRDHDERLAGGESHL
jgi:hypothetical protein